jgi:hypothetical protein
LKPGSLIGAEYVIIIFAPSTRRVSQSATLPLGSTAREEGAPGIDLLIAYGNGLQMPGGAL